MCCSISSIRRWLKIASRIRIVQPGAGEHLVDDVEDAVGAQRLAHPVELLEESLQDLALARVARNHVPDEDLVLLPVAVDAAHALLKPVGVPGDVVVDHQRAELQVDALARRLGGDHDLGYIAEGVLGLDAGVHHHRAVNGHDLVAPLDQLAQGSSLPSVSRQVVERVLELGEDQELAVAQVGQDVVAQRR